MKSLPYKFLIELVSCDCLVNVFKCIIVLFHADKIPCLGLNYSTLSEIWPFYYPTIQQ